MQYNFLDWKWPRSPRLGVVQKISDFVFIGFPKLDSIFSLYITTSIAIILMRSIPLCPEELHIYPHSTSFIPGAKKQSIDCEPQVIFSFFGLHNCESHLVKIVIRFLPWIDNELLSTATRHVPYVKDWRRSVQLTWKLQRCLVSWAHIRGLYSSFGEC